MTNKNSGFSFLVGIVVIIALVLVAMAISEYTRPKPPIEVSYALDPSTIRESEHSRLTLTIKNIDLKTHEIKVIFEMSSRISIYGGTEYLLTNNAYTFVLDASDPSEQRVFTLIGNLEAGTLSSQYPITFSVYVDGKELRKNWSDPVLTIQKP